MQNSYVSFFTLNNVQPGQAGSYRAVVTNAATTTGVGSSVATLTVLADTDHDGLPDAWEAAYGFGTNNPADATLDADGDTMSNWAEYIAGTNPTNALSYLKVERVMPLPTLATIEFVAISNRTYTIEYTDALGSSPWLKLNDVTARATNRVETVVDSGASATNRLYRLVTPVQLR